MLPVFALVLMVAYATPDLPFKSVAVMPIQTKAKASKATAAVLDDLILSALANQSGTRMRVIGKSDVDAMLGLDRAKEALGCSDVSCSAEIGGALGVASLITATLGTLGGKQFLTLVWIDQKAAKVYARHTETLGDKEEAFGEGVKRAVRVLLGDPESGSSREAPEGAAGAPITGAAQAQASPRSVSGTWSFDYEHPSGTIKVVMQLNEINGVVTGSYGAQGRIKGTMKGNRFTGTYDNNGVGLLRFDFDSERSAYTGAWGTGSELKYKASGRRLD